MVRHLAEELVRKYSHLSRGTQFINFKEAPEYLIC